jgi:hypothetical protein
MFLTVLALVNRMKPFLAAALLLLSAASAAAAPDVNFNVTDVVVYPQGTALVLQDAQVGGGNGFSAVLPGGVYVDSVRVSEDGGTVLKAEAYENPEEAPKLAAIAQWSVARALSGSVGSQVRFMTDYGEYSGVLSGFDEASGLMVLEAVNVTAGEGTSRSVKSAPFILMSSSQVREMVLDRKPQMPPPSPALQVQAYNPYYQQAPKRVRVVWEDIGAKARKARISYLSSGIGWSPVYHLDLPGEGGNARLSFIAQVADTAPANFSAVRLRLVGGSINIRTSQGYQQMWDSNTQSELNMRVAGYAMPSASYQPQRLSVDEYEVYDFPARQDLRAGGTLLLPVYDGDVGFRREYVWDARSSGGAWQGYSKYDSGDVRGRVQNIYLVKNSNRTWPAGTVSVYEGGLLIGQDTIMWTPQGAEAKVTVGFAPDIEVKRRETVKAFYRQNNYNEDYSHEARLTLKNRKPAKVAVTVMDEYPRNAHNFTASAPYEEEPGNLMTWKVELAPGQEYGISYQYVTE